MNLILGDCLEKLKDVEERSVDLVICDLPYGTTECKWDKKIDLDELWKQLKRVSKDNHTPYFFFCDMRLAVDIINSNPRWFRYDLILNKSNVVGFLNSSRMPMRKHEILLVFYKNLPTYNKDTYHKKIKVRSKNRKEGADDVYGDISKGRYGTDYEPKLPNSILSMDNKRNGKKTNHPTEKTQDILEWIIKYYSNEGDCVLDPTMGSGSTGVACKTLNRNFIGIELDDKYFEVASSRIFQDPK